MKQIAYLTMFFLPATFAAVRPPFSFPHNPFSQLLKYLSGSLWNERERDNAFHQRYPLAILCVDYPLHAFYCLDHHDGSEQVYIP